MKERLSNATVATSALLLCAAAAWTVAQFDWLQPHRLVVPFIFLGVVLLLGVRYGRLVGVLGSVLSAIIFAHALYAPIGSFFVADQSARSALAWALLLGVVASYLLLPTRDELQKKNR